MICKNCGATIQDTALFCNYCGHKQEKMTSPDFDMDKTVSVFDSEPTSFVPPAPVITQPVIQPPMPTAPAKSDFSLDKDFDPDATVGVYSQIPPVTPQSAPVPEPAVPVYEPAVPVYEPAVPVYEPAVPVYEPAVPVYTPVAEPAGISQPVADRMPPMDPRADKKAKKEPKEKKEKKGFSLFKKTPKTVAPVVVNVPMAPTPVVPEPVVAPVVPEPVAAPVVSEPVAAPVVPEPVVAPVVPEPMVAPVKPEPVVAPVVPEPVVAPVVPEPVVAPVVPEPTVKREITDKDIYEMAQKHEPFDIDTADAQKLFVDVIVELIPVYATEKKLETAMLMTAPADIKKNIANADTDTLFVAIKALNYYLSVGCDPAVLGHVVTRIYKVLKSRLS